MFCWCGVEWGCKAAFYGEGMERDFGAEQSFYAQYGAAEIGEEGDIRGVLCGQRFKS